MARKASWLEKFGTSCKIGTIPMVVRVHGRDKKNMNTNKWIKIQMSENAPWEEVYVREIWGNGYFQADR